MKKYPDARIKVLVLWAPYLRQDSKASAQRATAYLPDSRAEHFWDLWKFGSRIYAGQLNYPITEAWDLYVLYKPQLVWKGSPPKPTAWFQNRNLDHGTPYTQEALEEELKKWIR